MVTMAMAAQCTGIYSRIAPMTVDRFFGTSGTIAVSKKEVMVVVDMMLVLIFL